MFGLVNGWIKFIIDSYDNKIQKQISIMLQNSFRSDFWGFSVAVSGRLAMRNGFAWVARKFYGFDQSKFGSPLHPKLTDDLTPIHSSVTTFGHQGNHKLMSQIILWGFLILFQLILANSFHIFLINSYTIKHTLPIFMLFLFLFHFIQNLLAIQTGFSHSDLNSLIRLSSSSLGALLTPNTNRLSRNIYLRLWLQPACRAFRYLQRSQSNFMFIVGQQCGESKWRIRQEEWQLFKWLSYSNGQGAASSCGCMGWWRRGEGEFIILFVSQLKFIVAQIT